MCGRYTNRLSWSDIVRLYRIAENVPARNLRPRYNVAPTQDVPIVRLSPEGSREIAIVRWGLVPAWSMGPAELKLTLINARAETVASKPSFRSAFKARRCLVPADGYFEWNEEHGVKQPYWIRRPDGGPLTFAGLWERWEGQREGGAPAALDSCTIVVTDASKSLADLHDRMPVVLDETDWEAWLSTPPKDAGRLQPLLRPAPDGMLISTPVSRRVNSAKHDDAGCIEPAV